MAKKTVIRLNHTLDEYQKKYGDKHARIVNKVDADKDNSLIEGRTWWLIDEKYYEIPQSKCAPARWWTNMGTTGRVITCILGAGVIATAVAVPVALTMNQNTEYRAVVDPTVSDICKVSQKKLDNGALEITMTYDSSKELTGLELFMGNAKLVLNQDYNLTGDVIVINADALARYGTKEIIVKPAFKDKVFVTSVAITNTVLEVVEDQKIELTAKVLPENASNKEVTWNVTSKDGQALAESVDDKTYLKGIKPGKVTVTATAADGSGKSSTKEFTVKEKAIYVTGVTCIESLEMTVGDTIKFDALDVKITPENATDKTYTVEEGSLISANGSMFEIDNTAKTITAKTAGEGSVWVKPNGIDPEGEEMIVAICTIDVKPKQVLVTDVKITNTTTEVTVNDRIELTTTVLPEDATNKELEWRVTGTGEGAGTAHVSTDLETGVTYLFGDTAGKVTVTATALDGSGKSDSKEFTVIKEAKTASIDYDKLNTVIGEYGLAVVVNESTSSITEKAPIISITYTNTMTPSNINLGIFNQEGTLLQNIGGVEFKDSKGKLADITFNAWDKIETGDTIYFGIVKKANVLYSKLQTSLDDRGLEIQISTSGPMHSTDSITEAEPTLKILYENYEEDKTFHFGIYNNDGTLLEDIGNKTFLNNGNPVEITFTQWEQIENRQNIYVDIIATKAEFIANADERVTGHFGFCNSSLEYTQDQLTIKVNGTETAVTTFAYDGSGDSRTLRVSYGTSGNEIIASKHYSGTSLDKNNDLKKETEAGVKYTITAEEIIYQDQKASTFQYKELRINKYGYPTYMNYAGKIIEFIYNGEPNMIEATCGDYVELEPGEQMLFNIIDKDSKVVPTDEIQYISSLPEKIIFSPGSDDFFLSIADDATPGIEGDITFTYKGLKCTVHVVVVEE